MGSHVIVVGHVTAVWNGHHYAALVWPVTVYCKVGE